MGFQNSSKIRHFTIVIIFFVAFNILAFALPFGFGAAFWVVVLFTNISILAQIAIFSIAFDKADSPRRIFLGIPIAKLGFRYMCTQITLGVGILISGIFWATPFWLPLIPGVILLAMMAIAVIFADSVRTEIDRLETTQVANTWFINEFRADLESLISRIADNGLKQRVTKLSEEVRYSDPVSREELTGIESEMRSKFMSLKQAATDPQLAVPTERAIAIADEISHLLNERNQKCKILKRQPLTPNTNQN